MLRLRPPLDSRTFDPGSLASVVDQTLLEPWMAESLLCANPIFRVVNEYLLEKVKKLFVEVISRWDDLLGGF